MSENIYSDLLEEWNYLIVYKLKLNDIANPTSNLLTHIFVNYLKMLNLHVTPLIGNEEHICIQSKNILVNYINYLYTMSEKSKKFTLFDLINPTTKKTVHVLEILLNYLKYYNMVKNDIDLSANDVIQAYNKQLNKKNQLIIKNEKRKITLQKYDTKINEYKKQLPILTKDVQEIEKKNNFLVDEINKITHDIEDTKEEITHLLNTELKLKDKIITENEANKLLHTKELTANAIREQENIENDIKKSNLTIAKTIGNLENALSVCDKFMKNFENLLDFFKALTKHNLLNNEEIQKCVIVEKEIEELKQRIKKLENNIENGFKKNTEMMKANKSHELVVNEKFLRIKSEYESIEKLHSLRNTKLIITKNTIGNIDEEINFIKVSGEQIFEQIKMRFILN